MSLEPKCNLIIDSCSDLPYEMVDEEIARGGVELIEYPFIMSDGEHKDDLFKSMTAHEFYEGMRNGETPTTAQVPVTVYEDVFRRAFESGVPTVFLGFTSGLSGSHDTAMMVYNQLKEEYPDGELYMVDTLQASIAEGFLVYMAFEQRNRGLTAKELADWASEALYFVNDEFMVEDLNALHRGGRIPASVAYAGTKLDVKPMLHISLDGGLSVIGLARGRNKGIRQIKDYILQTMPENPEDRVVYIGNADCPKDAERLRSEIEKEDSSVRFIESSIGPVIGSHVGPGMVAAVCWGPDRRETLSVSNRIARSVKGQDKSSSK